MGATFKRPTVEELRAYAVEIAWPKFEAEGFLDHYEAVGWVVGRNRTPMKDWKAAVRLWRRNQREWAGESGPERDPAVLEYARQGRTMLAAALVDHAELQRFWGKVRDAIGRDGAARALALAKDRKVKL